MNSFTVSPPSRREIIFAGILLICTFFIFEQWPNLWSIKRRHDVHDSVEGHSGQYQDFVPEQTTMYPTPRLSWTKHVPETKFVVHAAGFTIFDNLYILNGTLFIVTSDPDLVPEFRMITSSGCDLQNGVEEVHRRLPTDKDIRVVSPSEALVLFQTPSSLNTSDHLRLRKSKSISGGSALRIDGVNWLISDSAQFIPHYYHFVAQMLIGMWRTYSTLDPLIQPDGRTTLPPPRRLFFTHLKENQWRDRAGLNQFVLRGSFPMIGLEFEEDWKDRAQMNIPFVFDRLLIADRAASNNGEMYKKTWRSAAEPFLALDGSPHFWNTIRNNMLEFSGLAAEWVFGPDPGMLSERQNSVITYISRQDWGRRSLKKEDHEVLVRELANLRKEFGYEVNIVSAEKLSRADQLQLAGRTTIMMGVHGNGLTALIWMRAAPKTTVMEFFYPEGFAFDYEYTARVLGIQYYGFWNDKYFSYPNIPKAPNYPDGFQSNNIPLNGAIVAKVVRERLAPPIS